MPHPRRHARTLGDPTQRLARPPYVDLLAKLPRGSASAELLAGRGGKVTAETPAMGLFLYAVTSKATRPHLHAAWPALRTALKVLQAHTLPLRRFPLSSEGPPKLPCTLKRTLAALAASPPASPHLCGPVLLPSTARTASLVAATHPPVQPLRYTPAYIVYTDGSCLPGAEGRAPGPCGGCGPLPSLTGHAAHQPRWPGIH
jgi:hypothetical protein